MALKEDLEKMKKLYHGGEENAFREHVTNLLATYTDEESKALFAQCVDELSESTLREVEKLCEDCEQFAVRWKQ